MHGETRAAPGSLQVQGIVVRVLMASVRRRRTLVAIGTHDLDTIEGPFSYEALAPRDISFAPLNNQTVMNAEELMEHYEKVSSSS